jgi:hypothetical protein
MAEPSQIGTYQAIHTPPSAVAQDGGVLVSVIVAEPTYPERIAEIDLALPLSFAKHLIVQLREAVVAAQRSAS